MKNQSTFANLSGTVEYRCTIVVEVGEEAGAKSENEMRDKARVKLRKAVDWRLADLVDMDVSEVRID